MNLFYLFLTVSFNFFFLLIVTALCFFIFLTVSFKIGFFFLLHLFCLTSFLSFNCMFFMFLNSVPDVSHFCLTVWFNLFFFLLHLFTVSLNFQVTQSLLAYFLPSLLFNFFESLFTSWCCFISYFLLAFFLLHLFIELILLPHLIIQVKHCWIFPVNCNIRCHLLAILLYVMIIPRYERFVA